MNENNRLTTVHELFKSEPTRVQAWLDLVWSGRECVAKDFNWLLLAEHSGFLAHHLDDLEWAKVGIRVYEWLHRVSLDYFDLSSMYLRAAFIVKRGAVPGDPYLDLNLIVKWFYDTLPLSFAETQQGIPTCRETIARGNINGPEDLRVCRDLRLIKNHLNVLSFLVENSVLLPDEQLGKWLEIKTSLP